MANKKVAKGKRYTPEEKATIVEFVQRHNAEHGRGGQTAAATEFGVSQLSIGAWLKKSPVAAKASKRAKADPEGSLSERKRSKLLSELSQLDQVIANKRKEVDALEVKFAKLKAQL